MLIKRFLLIKCTKNKEKIPDELFNSTPSNSSNVSSYNVDPSNVSSPNAGSYNVGSSNIDPSNSNQSNVGSSNIDPSNSNQSNVDSSDINPSNSNQSNVDSLTLCGRIFLNLSFSHFPPSKDQIKFKFFFSKLRLKYAYTPKLLLTGTGNEDFYNKMMMMDLDRIFKVNNYLIKRVINTKKYFLLNEIKYLDVLNKYKELTEEYKNLNGIPEFILDILNKNITSIASEVRNFLPTIEEEKVKINKIDDGDDGERLKVIRKIENYTDLPNVIKIYIDLPNVEENVIENENVENLFKLFNIDDLLKICEILNVKFNKKLVNLKDNINDIKVKTNHYFKINPIFCEIKIFDTKDPNYIKEEHYLSTICQNLRILTFELNSRLKNLKKIIKYFHLVRKKNIKLDKKLLKLKGKIDEKIDELKFKKFYF